jgi:hypothetical protein
MLLKNYKLIGAGLSTIGLAGTGVGIGTVNSVRTMHTIVSKIENKSSSSDPQKISPFMEKMLKWENPEIDLSQGVNYSGIKAIAIFFKKIGYDSFISFFDSSKSGASFISSKLENIGSSINFKLENFNFDSLSHSNLSISFKSICYRWVPYKPEGFIKESLFFLFQHWHITSVVVGATAYFIFMHFFNDANDSSSASSEEHISDDGSVGSDNATAPVVDRLSPPPVGGDVESKEAEAPIKASFILETRIPNMLAYFKFQIIKNIISELQPIVIANISAGRPTWDYDIDQIMSQVFKPSFENVINIQDVFDCYVERVRDAQTGVTTAVFIREILDKTKEERLVFGDAFIANVSSHFIEQINNDEISDFLNQHYNTTDF